MIWHFWASLPKALTEILSNSEYQCFCSSIESAIKELQAAGYDVPDYPDEPKNAEEEAIKAQYSKNWVLPLTPY